MHGRETVGNAECTLGHDFHEHLCVENGVGEGGGGTIKHGLFYNVSMVIYDL